MTAASKLHRRELFALAGASALTALGFEGDAIAASKATRVPRRTLGKTGQKIPILLVGGAVRLDPTFDPKLAEALKHGVNYIDAADCYSGGRCESAVGSFHKIAKVRKKLWITSKSDAHDARGFMQTFESSLAALKTNYIDMYFLHAFKDSRYLNQKLYDTVARLKKQKRLRFFGFSCHDGNVVELLHKAAKTPWVDAVMFRYNFRKYGDQALNKAIDACYAAKVGLIAMKTQGSAVSFKDRWQKLTKQGRFTKPQAVLKAVWADRRITAAVSHMDSLSKLRENIAAALDRRKLSREEVDALQHYAQATRQLACDGCDHLCGAQLDEPVRIGETLRYLMYHDVYGEAEKARQLFQQMPAEAQRLLHVNFERASVACPNGVNIAWHMRRAARVLGAPAEETCGTTET